MKRYLFLLLLVLFAACRHADRTFEILDKAEELIQANEADSAYTLLKEIPNPQQYPEKERARWCLLMTQAIDRTYRTHTSDSLIRFVIRFYEGKKDLSELPTAYYLLGRVQKDLGDNEKSVSSFLKALDLAKEDGDYKLQYLSASQLGNIFESTGFINEAFRSYQQALHFAEQGKYSVNMAYANIYLGRVYGLLKVWDQAIVVFQRSISIAEHVSNTLALQLGLNELADTYIHIQKYQDAFSCLQKILYLKEKSTVNSKAVTYLHIADLFRLMGNYDSAYVSLNKALMADNQYTRRTVYQHFCYLFEEQGDYKKAVEYNKRYWACNDSIQNAESDIILDIETKYLREKLLAEKQQQELKQSKLIFWGSSLLFVAIIIILLVYMDKKRTTIRLFEQLHKIRFQMAENKRIIASYQEQMDSLSLRQSNYDDLQQKKALLEQEVSNLVQRNEKLNNQKLQILIRLNQKDEEIKQYEEIIKQRENTPDIFARIKRTLTLEEKEWPELIARTDALHRQFTERLRKAFPQLTDIDLRLCCLLRLGYGRKEQIDLLKVTDDNLDKRRQRLKRRLDPDKK